ncbi:MAG: serine/threonine protein kinase, partial [Deltaproteobacteria bacterium]|nr:serine/threonine protein kinase [Deltaproteobacteria bacterium]
MTFSEHEDLVGKVLAGVYALEEVIATGSMSTIYRATNRRLDQQVAVKLLFGSFTTNAALKARFEAEAKVQAKLNHPHILRVSDFVSDKGSFAIVMELVEGAALDQILYDIGGPMDLRRVRTLLLPVLDAVSYAHSQGIVHRDIKPSNIIVTHVGKTEFPKVMDFGIAKILAEGSSTTAPGAMLGTLLFMSPEQCKALKSVDERADIYAIGVTLYQMTTGMVPFYAESAFEIMLAHVQTPPTPPKELLPGFPDALQTLILRALAKDPEERFQSASELAAALEALPLAAEGQSEIAGAGLPTDGEAEVRVVGDDASSHVANQEKASASFISRDNMTVPSLDASLGARAVRPRTLEGLPQVGTPVQSMGSEATDPRPRRG